MELRSEAFEDGGMIPAKYTCDGADINPPLHISEVPAGAEALALVVDDPDAPGMTFVHWTVWNMPVDLEEISEGTQPDGVEGRTDFGRIGYGGPCPPSGTHTYRFRLFALDSRLGLERGADKSEVADAIEKQALEEVVLRGRYGR